MFDIAFDPSGSLWGVSGSGNLYQIDKDTAAITLVGFTGTSPNSLVFDSAGTAYAANSALWTIDTTTGTATQVGFGGFPYTSSGDLSFVGGNLYLSAIGGGTNDLVLLDTTTGAGTLVGDIGFASVLGLASDNNLDLFGTAGTQVLSIDPTTGAGAALVDYAGQGLSDAYGAAFITEAGATPSPGDGPGSSVSEPGILGLLAFGILLVLRHSHPPRRENP